MESKAAMVLDGATVPDARLALATGGDGGDRRAMRAVSLFGLASDGAGDTAASERGCKIRESGGRGDNSGGRNGAAGRVVSGFWGSTGSMTNQVVPGKIAENFFFVTRKMG